ncbi:MAG: type II secretion system protein [Clostridia bacterium]|nr:type II secretion system protein [Clostridia bacterium]
MKRNNKKGFTIVELVIVIAVIAILSAVLIPTFGSVIEDANKTAAQQEARNLYTSYIQECTDDDTSAPNAGDLDKDICFQVDSYWFTVVDGQLSDALDTAPSGKADTALGTVGTTSVFVYTAPAAEGGEG